VDARPRRSCRPARPVNGTGDRFRAACFVPSLVSPILDEERNNCLIYPHAGIAVPSPGPTMQKSVFQVRVLVEVGEVPLPLAAGET